MVVFNYYFNILFKRKKDQFTNEKSSMKFNEYKGLNLPQIADEILGSWRENNTFFESIRLREGKPSFVFY